MSEHFFFMKLSKIVGRQNVLPVHQCLLPSSDVKGLIMVLFVIDLFLCNTLAPMLFGKSPTQLQCLVPFLLFSISRLMTDG